ncbi:restriction endonuclease subunit S [Lysobacter maris]|uniref:Restriction endonuclease subunit S n=1 Tax=Marilutibacter maris TaxID=1605891 RepID=A0A508B554_9GAMM|nr:restriction endonuclease subunit S [Lysobacter maris]KAB8198439.1 restriction endonuclease subunit S [Lysobacter maris]
MTWPLVKLSSGIADVVRGVTFSQGDSVREAQEGYLPVLRAGNISETLVTSEDLVWIPQRMVSERQLLKRNDIVMCTSSGSASVVGKTAIAENDFDGSWGAFNVVIRPSNTIDAKFLHFWLQSGDFRSWRDRNAKGASIQNIRHSDLMDLDVPLPPPSEQQRIVELLDQADALRRLRRAADAKATRILPALFLKMFGDPASNPMGWAMKSVSQVIASVDAGWSASSEGRPSVGEEHGVLKVSAVTSGRFRPEENKAVLEIPDDRTLIAPKRGDLLFSRANTRELVAATCVVEGNYPRLFLSDKLWRLTPHAGEASTLFLKQLFWNDGVREKFRASSSGSSGSMLNISKSAMLRTQIPVPPFEMQMQFEQVAWSVIETVNNAATAGNGVESLWNSLLQKAFIGEMTAKWREAHMTELLAEMQQQAKALNLPLPQGVN